jgi:hypothetical protein
MRTSRGKNYPTDQNRNPRAIKQDLSVGALSKKTQKVKGFRVPEMVPE